MYVESVFISYSHKDRSVVLELVKAQEGLYDAAFVDSEHTPAGEDWKEYHNDKIQNADRLVLCWSKSAALSKHVEREWRLALERGIKIIPVFLDKTPLPPDLRHLHAISLREYITEQHWTWLRYFSFSISRSNVVLPGAIAIGAGIVLLVEQLLAIYKSGITPSSVLFGLVSTKLS